MQVARRGCSVARPMNCGENRAVEDLKAELQLVKDASELFDSTAVVDPKGGSGSPRDS